MSTEYEYGEVDLDEIQKDHAADARPKLPILKLREGKNALRFLPPAKGETKPWRVFWAHGIGEDKSFRSFQCPEKMLGQPCPVCARVSDLYRTNNEADRELANKLRARQEAYANVVDMQNPSQGVQVLKMAEGTYRDIRSLMVGDEKSGEPGVNFTHPDKGMNVLITREGTSRNTKYKGIGLSPSGAKPIANREWLGQMHDLSQAVRAMPPEQVLALLDGREAPKQIEAQAEAAGKTRTIADDPDLQ